jgi:hypothetical protein
MCGRTLWVRRTEVPGREQSHPFRYFSLASVQPLSQRLIASGGQFKAIRPRQGNQGQLDFGAEQSFNYRSVSVPAADVRPPH